jgi:hypothetical protein
VGSGAANANLSNLMAGQRYFSISNWSSSPNLSQGRQYWIAWFWSSSNVLNQTGSMMGLHWGSLVTFSGTCGVSQTTGSTKGPTPFFGVYTATTSALPASIAASQIAKAGVTNGFFVPHLVMMNHTAISTF